MKISNIPENFIITEIGDLFKYEGKPWFINLVGSSNQELSRHKTSFSNMNILSRRRIINSTKNDFRKEGYKLEFKCPSPEKWESFIQHKSKCYYFRFKAIVEFSNNKIKEILIELPQLELARVLFFQNAYLTRSALELNVLNEDFDIQSKVNCYQINILPSVEDSLFISNFNNPDFCRYLAFILINDNMRFSYESMAQRREITEICCNNYRKWEFNFIPPNLSAVKIIATGYYDSDNNTYRVNEITAITELYSHINKPVYFRSNKFFETKLKSDKSSLISPLTNIGQPILSDDVTSSLNSNPTFINSPRTIIHFKDPFETRRITTKSASTYNVIVDESTECGNESDQNVNADEPGKSGTVQPADFNGILDESDDAQIYLDRFSAFQEMLDLLKKKFGIDFSLAVKKLPNIQGFSKHLKSDYSPRCIADVQFNYNGNKYILLEVDTSDDITRLSTQLLMLNDITLWEDDYKKIRYYIVQKSINWPIKFIRKISISQIGINHPRCDQKSGNLTKNDLEKWANRIFNHLI